MEENTILTECYIENNAKLYINDCVKTVLGFVSFFFLWVFQSLMKVHHALYLWKLLQNVNSQLNNSNYKDISGSKAWENVYIGIFLIVNAINESCGWNLSFPKLREYWLLLPFCFFKPMLENYIWHLSGRSPDFLTEISSLNMPTKNTVKV